MQVNIFLDVVNSTLNVLLFIHVSQKTESQLSGYLYKKGSNASSSWTNRFVTLSTDTGTMKFYIEKSG